MSPVRCPDAEGWIRSLDAYLDEWLALLRMRVQPTTFKAYDDIIRGYLRPGRGHLRIGDLTVRQLNLCLVQPLQQGGLRVGSLRRSTVKYAHASLRQSLGEAVSDDLLDDNVTTLPASLHTTGTASAAPHHQTRRRWSTFGRC